MSPIVGNTVSYETPQEQSPHDIAVAAIEERVIRQFAQLTNGEVSRRAQEDSADPDGADKRASKYEEQDRNLIGMLRDRAVGVYESARERRGDLQAAADATSSAIGLPVDPEARQAEIERRERDLNAAHRMQMGQGEQYAILDGTQPNPNGLARIDQAMPDPSHPWLQTDHRGRGDNVNRQIADVQNGLVDMRTGERFATPQPELLARAQNSAPLPPPPPGSGPAPDAARADEQRKQAQAAVTGEGSPMANIQGEDKQATSGEKLKLVERPPAKAEQSQSRDDRLRDLLARAKQERDKPKS
jgi:hypothetical protein